MLRRPLLLAAFLASLAGCDQLGLESASVVAARVEADGKAVGAACRHGGRAIEDCFTLNKRVDKAAIYAGWREMDDYMRENKIEAVAPELGADPKPKTVEADDASDEPAASAAKPAKTAQADKPADKGSAKPMDKGAKVDKAADKMDKVGKTDKGGDKPADKIADKGEKTVAADASKPAASH